MQRKAANDHGKMASEMAILCCPARSVLRAFLGLSSGALSSGVLFEMPAPSRMCFKKSSLFVTPVLAYARLSRLRTVAGWMLMTAAASSELFPWKMSVAASASRGERPRFLMTFSGDVEAAVSRFDSSAAGREGRRS